MKSRDQALLLAAVAAAIALWPRRSDAAIAPAREPFDPGIDVYIPTMERDDAAELELEQLDGLGLLGVGLPTFEDWSQVLDTPSINEAALLYAIRRAEHRADDVASGMDYLTFYGGATFIDTRDHPVITGELRAVRLTREQCLKLGFTKGVCYSTAAGGYQITRPTWVRVRERRPRLPDFSPASQDEAARRLLEEIGAIRAVRAGDIGHAVELASSLWASLPGSKAGQPQRSFEELYAFYRDAGGIAT